MQDDLIWNSSQGVCSGSGFIALDIILRNQSSNSGAFAGGSCGNVLTILSFMGWQSYPIARIGSDAAGNVLLKDMSLWGVKTELIEQDPGIGTPCVLERITEQKHYFEFKCPECGRNFPKRSPIRLHSVNKITEVLASSDIFYFDRVSPAILELARRYKKEGAMIVFEPPRFKDSKLFLEALDIAHIVKHCYSDKDDDVILGSFPKIEIQTMGEEGLRYRSNLFNDKGEWTLLTPFLVHNLVDSAGAGDWCTAGIIQAIKRTGALSKLSRKKLERTLAIGQALGALNCHYEGARGMMYSLTKSQIIHAVDKMIHRQSIQDIINNPPKDIRTKQEICICKV